MTASTGTDSRSTPADLPPLLRRRLLIVSLLTVVATIFFAAFRAVQPAEWAYFLASRSGVAVLVAEAAVGLIAAVAAVALSRRPGWWTLRRLRALEYVLVFDMAVYVGWSQLFAFHGERLAGGAAADPYLIRLATDSMAVRSRIGAGVRGDHHRAGDGHARLMMPLPRPALAVLIGAGRRDVERTCARSAPGSAPRSRRPLRLRWQPQAERRHRAPARGERGVGARWRGPAAPPARCCAPPTAAAPGSAGSCLALRRSTSATSTPSTPTRRSCSASARARRRASTRPSDGGATWTERFRNADPDAFFDAIAFADATHGAAVSDSVAGRFVIRLTADGGRTWTPVPADRLPPALPGEGAFAASGTNVTMAGRDHIWIGTTAARVLRSHDGGRSWSVHPTPLATGEATGIFSIAFRDDRVGVVVGGNYQREGEAVDNAAITSDGGATWTLVATPGLSGFRSAVAWLPAAGRPLLAVGPGGADWSADQGRTWRAAGGEGYDAFSVAPQGDAGWASGSGGRIARLTFAAR